MPCGVGRVEGASLEKSGYPGVVTHENGNGTGNGNGKAGALFRAGAPARGGRYALFEPPTVDKVAVEERAASLAKRSIKKGAKVAGLKLAMHSSIHAHQNTVGQIRSDRKAGKTKYIGSAM